MLDVLGGAMSSAQGGEGGRWPSMNHQTWSIGFWRGGAWTAATTTALLQALLVTWELRGGETGPARTGVNPPSELSTGVWEGTVFFLSEGVLRVPGCSIHSPNTCVLLSQLG